MSFYHRQKKLDTWATEIIKAYGKNPDERMLVFTRVKVEMVGSGEILNVMPKRFVFGLNVEIETKELKGNFNILSISYWTDTTDRFGRSEEEIE